MLGYEGKIEYDKNVFESIEIKQSKQLGKCNI